MGGNITFFVATPATIPSGAYAHYVADDLSDISTWPGHNGAGPTLDNAVGAITLNTGLNGHKYVRFGHNACFIDLTPIPDIPSEITAFGIVKKEFVDDGYFDFGIEDSGSRPYALVVDRGANQFSLVGMNTTLIGPVSRSAYLTDNVWYLMSYRYKNSVWFGGDKTGELRLNGSQIATTTIAAFYDGGQSKYIRLGHTAYIESNDCEIAEVVYYQSILSDEQMTSAESYLMDKYGIS